MTITLDPGKDYLSETEVSQALGISVERLHCLLDENVFHDGTEKPSRLYFRPADVVMIEFWLRNAQPSKLLKMPRRR